MELTLRQLTCLVAVADHGSISGAAVALDVSQPTVTHQLQQLEQVIGQRLLDRHARGVVVRPEGEVVLQRARKIVQAAQAIADDLAEPGMVRGDVKVGIVPTAASYRFPELYRRLSSQYPLIKVEIWEETTPALVDGIKQGDLDLALGTLPLPYVDVTLDRLWREELMLIAPPGDDEWGAGPVPIAMLANRPYIGIIVGNGVQTRVVELFHGAGIQPNVRFEARTIPTVVGLVAAGLGVAIIPEQVARLYSEAGQVLAFSLEPRAFRQLVLIHRPLESLRPAAQAVAKFFQNQARRMVTPENRRP